MKLRCLLAVLLAGSLLARAQEEMEMVSLPDIIAGAQQWAEENLDTNVLNALPAVDQAKVQQLLRDLQQRFQGDYIVDLAALRQPAEVIVPLLESHPETQPYAAWLKARLDYLQVADEFRLLVPPPAARAFTRSGQSSPSARGPQNLRR